ncbi:lipase 3-like [Culicoides brevitarsis]|uniref:lipase 3-like n=1 Tax=Culicoides brevitarsis TaxID=469753 RepID=UPI00307C7D7A
MVKNLIGGLMTFFTALLNVNLPEHLQDTNAVGKVITREGYPYEMYTVPTDDGYLLGMHHIPAKNPLPQHNNVLLMHAAMTAGGQFVINGNKSLAFMLADAGYNVWIIHARGTSYSLKHQNLSSDDPKFWDFSWHEIGMYDIPNTIDFILRKTGDDKLHFVGHSQGPTAFLVMMCERPEYNEKVKSSYLLGPAVYLHNTYKLMRGMTNLIVDIAKERKLYKIQMKESALLYLLLNFCKGPVLSLWCTMQQLNALGGDTGQILDRHAFKHTIAKYARDNISSKILWHFAQVQNSERFEKYDYGKEENLMRYGSIQPPLYNLTRVTVPIVLAYGTRDSLTKAEDTEILIPQLKSITKVIKLPWNHVDMIIGRNVDTQLYNNILGLMART